MDGGRKRRRGSEKRINLKAEERKFKNLQKTGE